MDSKRYGYRGAIVVLVLCALIGWIVFSPPQNFPKEIVVNIAKGSSAAEVVAQLAEAHIITHPELLRIALHLSGGSLRIQPGPYLFNTPENIPTIAYRLMSGNFGIPSARITFREGETVREIAKRVHEALSSIPVSTFISAAQPYEGYLFPDTYLFLPSSDAEVIIQTMRENFTAKTAVLTDAIEQSGHSLIDLVTMASLIEREARSIEVKRMVSGILWNRIRIGMPLQVDAVFGYIYGRDTYSPSFADLKVDSPYNTYLYKGLPPGPISNPGFDSLDAAIHPTSTEYLYYLTGKDGLMHYATTYSGHLANQKKYLR
ncbi:endolytic transglycosylase MltG [Candidatus Kaiserbacteria bacterium]|nr:endolytic transglycosylase MltG [Candidatus Kaiserbacteria bacterium]